MTAWDSLITKERSVRERYGAALLLTLCSLQLNSFLFRYTERNLSFLVLAATILSALLGGYGPGVVALLLSGVALKTLFLPPSDLWSPIFREELVQVFCYLVAGGFLVFLSGYLRLSLHRVREAGLRAEAAMRARDEFMSVVSHELKNPLTALRLQTQIGLRQVARGEGTTPDRFRRYLSTVDASLETMQRLIGEMTDLGRVLNQRLELRREAVDLAELAESVVDRFAPLAESRGFRLTTKLDSILGEWDPVRLDQVLSNLLGNAIKYGATPVEVETSSNGDEAVLSVRDHGRGISPENLGRIFRRFERLEPAGAVEGLGLGLFITQKIVEAHGGKLSVESKVGEGCVFRVVLPRGLPQTLIPGEPNRDSLERRP